MLEYRDVNISIGRNRILENISVDFEKGKITSIIGPNGCGKTTLLQVLNGMSQVANGEVYIDNENYLRLSLRERAKKLSFLPQIRENAPSISVRGLVEHGRFPYMGFSRKMSEEDRAAVKYALEFTELSGYKDQLVSELSGGLQQRVYLAMQLAQDSQYMVLDEPMNHLDFPGQREMYKLIRELNRKGKTIILVLHDLGQALQISDKLVVMKDRRIERVGSPRECLEDGTLEKVFECVINEVDINGSSKYIFI